MTTLATFVHVSDLHFGTLDPSSLSAANRWWMTLPYLNGYLGHSERAIWALDRRFSELRKSDGAGLIVTGDLTSCGKASEFGLFDDFAGSDPPSSALRFLGLRMPGWKDRAIPGNHDHWPGALTIFGPPDPTLYWFFPDLPRLSAPLNLGHGYKLRFMWIDSDIDVGAYSDTRFRARGSFRAHLEILEAELKKYPPEEKEIRALAIHHSPTYEAPRHKVRSLQINGRSRGRLMQFIIDHRIGVVLCGHIHNVPYVQPEMASHEGRSALFLEARCGSTSQARPSDLIPEVKAKLRALGVRFSEHTNSLLVHRIIEEQGKAHWQTEIYLLNPAAFEKPAQSFLQNRQPVTVRFRIWPP